MRKLAIYSLTLLLLSSCAELNTLVQSLPTDAPLTEAEVSEGLKEALVKGSEQAAGLLGMEDGYYGDALVKILLPEEAAVIVDNLSMIPGGEELVQDVVLRINRAAEDAAKEAAPIFISSIRQMSIADAFEILRGEDDAATRYLERTSRSELYRLYRPKIRQSTEKDIIGGLSTKDSWDALTGQWNRAAGSVAGRLAGLKPVEVDLDDYLTNRALDGLFLKVEDEEKHIRTEIEARTSALLRKVFGSLD